MLTKDTSTPLHTQISNTLREQILGRQYQPGARLPSERQLCEMYNVSRITVRKSMAELSAQHLIYSVAGMGSFVTVSQMNDTVLPLSSFTEDMARRGMTAYSQILEAHVSTADADLAALMHISPGEEIIYLKRLRLVKPDHLPVAIQVCRVHRRKCLNLLDFDLQNRSLYEVIKNEFGLRLSRGETTISAGLASPEEAKALQVILPSSVLVTDQITYLENNEVIELTHSVFRSDLYHLSVIT